MTVVRGGADNSHVVPDFVGSAATLAHAWVGKKVDLKAHLGPLNGGDASSLFLN